MNSRTSSAGKLLRTQTAALAGVALVTLGLFVWGSAEPWAQRADRVDVALWCVRCLAISAIAAGQVLFALAVVPGFFARRGSLEQGYALATGLVLALSAVTGGALAAAAGW